MKIAIVSDAIYPYNKGGKEKRIYEISTRLVALGHDIHIYTMHWWRKQKRLGLPGGDRDGLPRGVETGRLENGVYLHAISPYYPLYSGERRSIKQAIMFGLHCLKLIKEDFDVVDVDHMPFFPLYAVKLVCLLKRKKMFATWNEVWGLDYWKKYLGLLGYLAYLIEKVSLYLPDVIISISPHTTKRLREEMNMTKPIETIEMGIDLDFINSVKPAKETSDIIFIGRLLAHKNVDVLIKAVKLLITHHQSSITCFIIGSGPEKQNLIELTKNLGIEKHVIFKGAVESQKEIYALMKSSKVFVLPSTREGFGIVVLEANACGIPVISVDHPDNAAKDLIKKNVNGVLTMLDINQIAEVIRKVLKNQSRFHLVNDSNHSWDKTKNKILEVYKV